METYFKMISDTTRLRIVCMLLDSSLCVSEMSAIMQIPISTISRHLSKLSLAGMISDQQSAQWVYYCINEEFGQDNTQLLEYIKNRAESTDILVNDIDRLHRYRQSDCCCRDVNTHRESVNRIMSGE